MVGDFNGTVNNKLDRLGKKKATHLESKLPRTCFYFTLQEHMCDLWRFYNPEVKDFTFHSARHQSFSRINMIWATKELLFMRKIEILPKIASDHNPILWVAKGVYKQYNWRLNEDLLLNQEILPILKNELNYYFKLNLNKGTSIQTVWEAHKAVMRGNLMSLNAKDKRQKQMKLDELQKEIKTKEKEQETGQEINYKAHKSVARTNK